MAAMAGSLVHLLLSLLALSSTSISPHEHPVTATHPPPIAAKPTPPPTRFSDNGPLLSEIEDLKTKVSFLETKLEETNRLINAKILYVVECEKRIEDLINKINDLQSFLSNSKSASLEDARVVALEEEVRVLWENSRKNNFLLHMFESKVEDAEERLESITSQVEKMSGIVTELWIQIQQLEQALQISQMSVVQLHRQRRYARCVFFKVVGGIRRDYYHITHFVDHHILGEGSLWNSFLSKVRRKIESCFRAMKKYHHQLQGLVRQEMERYSFAASLANDEVVFFVASALVVFPLLGAWFWLSSDR